MTALAVIPARYKSTRFPGKPLADIAGRPMIAWVWDQANKAKEIDRFSHIDFLKSLRLANFEVRLPSPRPEPVSQAR